MPRTRIAPTTATKKLCRLKPLMEPPMPNMVASQPPTTAPTGQEKSTTITPRHD